MGGRRGAPLISDEPPRRAFRVAPQTSVVTWQMHVGKPPYEAAGERTRLLASLPRPHATFDLSVPEMRGL